jgi:predicted LPLAT superfamily acyltransferase
LNRLLRRFSIYGDFWLRYLHWGTRHCPWFLEPVFVFAFTVMFWLVLKKARHAVARNLAVILPGSSPMMNQLRVFRVFWNFAWTMVDVGHVRHGESCIRWEVTGMKHLNELENSDSGAILITAHMGNYDVAAPLFAQKIHKPIHLVRTPERERESQEFEKDKRDRQVTGNFVIHYNEPGNMLAVTLAHAISAGGIVAIQGDRILFDVSPMKVAFKDGVDWQVPRGPFMLAMVAKVAIHPVFIIRMGWRRYRIQAEPAIEIPSHDRERDRVQAEAAAQWTSVMRRVAESHWHQWFVFEDLFQERIKALEAETENKVSEPRRPHPGGGEERVDLMIPSDSRRGVNTVFLWNALAGGLTAAVVLRRLLEWGVGSWLRVLVAIVAWPLVWFVGMVLLVQAVLGGALLLMKWFRVPADNYDVLATGLMLTIFAGVAGSEWGSGCPVGYWLGALGLVAIVGGVAQELISRRVPE